MGKLHRQTFGAGKPIVMIHGWAMHSAIWRDFAGHLAQYYRVTCIDLPGHGASGKISPFTLEQVGDALVDAVPDEQSCWLGWSLGATIALDIAERYPERVNALILLAGNPHFTQAEAWPGMKTSLLESFADNLAEDCQATLLRFLSLQVLGLPNAKALTKALKAAVLAHPAADAESLRGGLDVLKNADLRTAFARVKAPVSVVLGKKDSLVPVALGQHLMRLLPAAQIHLLDQAAHAPFLSHPQEVSAIISDFIDQHVF